MCFNKKKLIIKTLQTDYTHFNKIYEYTFGALKRDYVPESNINLKDTLTDIIERASYADLKDLIHSLDQSFTKNNLMQAAFCLKYRQDELFTFWVDRLVEVLEEAHDKADYTEARLLFLNIFFTTPYTLNVDLIAWLLKFCPAFFDSNIDKKKNIQINGIRNDNDKALCIAGILDNYTVKNFFYLIDNRKKLVSMFHKSLY